MLCYMESLLILCPSYLETIDSSSVHLPCRLVTFGNFQKSCIPLFVEVVILDQLTSSLKKTFVFS
jgi:hypothetical protein